MYILLVEPDHAFATIVSNYLRKAGHKTRIVATADQAIASCDMQRPDAILLELALGQHSGVEFLHEFRSYKDWASVPVIVLTMLQITKLDMLKKLGIHDYLYKPKSSLSELSKSLQKIHV